MELMSMPTFCWWEFDARYAQTVHEIRDCGPGMNHYCGAYLQYVKSRAARDRGAKLSALRRANQEIEYTIHWMGGHPNCSIRGHVEEAYMKVRAGLAGLGDKLAPQKSLGR